MNYSSGHFKIKIAVNPLGSGGYKFCSNQPTSENGKLNKKKDNKMLKYLNVLIIMIMFTGCSYAVQPEIIQLKNDIEYDKYLGSDGSSDIKFNIDDYVGTWGDPSKYDADFTLTENLNIKMDIREGQCKILEQNNNTLLLQCSGLLAASKKGGLAKVENQYIGIKIFYYSDSKTKASKRIHITFNQNKDCAQKGSADKECWSTGSEDKNVYWMNKEYRMYKKI